MGNYYLLQSMVVLFALGALCGALILGLRFSGVLGEREWVAMNQGLLVASGVAVLGYGAFWMNNSNEIQLYLTALGMAVIS